jgi:hypothetical protein
MAVMNGIKVQHKVLDAPVGVNQNDLVDQTFTRSVKVDLHDPLYTNSHT